MLLDSLFTAAKGREQKGSSKPVTPLPVSSPRPGRQGVPSPSGGGSGGAAWRADIDGQLASIVSALGALQDQMAAMSFGEAGARQQQRRQRAPVSPRLGSAGLGSDLLTGEVELDSTDLSLFVWHQMSHYGGPVGWFESVRAWRTRRNQAEAGNLCLALERAVQEGLSPGDSPCVDVIVRRLVGVYHADTSKTWQVADQIQDPAVSRQILPQKALQQAVKRAAKVRAMKKSVGSGDGSSDSDGSKSQ